MANKDKKRGENTVVIANLVSAFQNPYINVPVFSHTASACVCVCTCILFYLAL